MSIVWADKEFKLLFTGAVRQTQSEWIIKQSLPTKSWCKAGGLKGYEAVDCVMCIFVVVEKLSAQNWLISYSTHQRSPLLPLKRAVGLN